MRTYGVERERFITNAQGEIVSAVGTLLPLVHQIASNRGLANIRFTYELFAGQIEDRTPPAENLQSVETALLENDEVLLAAADRLGLAFNHSEFVTPEKVVSFEVNPFDERHQQIWREISLDRRIPASTVTGVHVHISASENEAVKVLNRCRSDVIDRLIAIGDHSNLQRVNAYRTMAGVDGVPPLFACLSELMEYINAKGGEKNVWDFVRYKPSTQTVEFRMFGATQNVDEILGYVKACQQVFGI